MKKSAIIGIILGLSMAGSSAITILIKPTKKLADQQAKFDLAELIPRSFSGWEIDGSIVPIAVATDVLQKLNVVYDQTLSRTYANAKGERIMLSIAYGSQQNGESTQVHRPEFCYTAQGFDIVSNKVGMLTTHEGNIPIRRLKAVNGARIEPITYWLTIGTKATLPGFGRIFTQLSYGLTGVVADGMLVRISSIGASETNAYQLQDAFINALLQSMNKNARTRLIGKLDN